MTVRQLRLCFVAMKQFVLDHWEGEYTFVQRGLFISDSGLLEPALATLLTALFQLEGERANSNLVSNAFVKLLSTGSKLGRQLLSHGAFGCLHRFRDQDFIDLTLHPLVLNSILMEIQLDGEMRVIKKVWVPEILARQFRKFWHVLQQAARPFLSSGDGCATRAHRGG